MLYQGSGMFGLLQSQMRSLMEKTISWYYHFDKADRKLWKEEINAGGLKMMMQLIEL